MELRAEGIITKEDLGIAQKHIMKSAHKEMKKKHQKILGLIPLAIIGLLIGLSLNYFKGSIAFDYKLILYGVLIASIVLLILTKLHLIFFKRLASDKGIYLGKHSFTIKEDGIVEESDAQSTTLKWSGVLNIEETSNMIFIFVDSIAANFIPKHFFSDDIKMKNFVSLIR